MLQTIHDKLKGWVAGLVLGAIEAFPFELL